MGKKNLRGLDQRQPQHILTECVLDLTVHVLSKAGKVHGDILRGWVVLPYRKDGVLGLVIADGKLKELNSKVVAGQRAQKA